MAKRGRRSRFAKRRTLPGASPGTMAPEPGAPKPEIRVTAYGPERLEEARVESAEALRGHPGRHPVAWIHVDGLCDPPAIEAIGALFDFHRLALADVVNVPQRPKGEDYGDTFFLVLRMPRTGEGLEIAQIGMFVRDGLVATFQSCPDDLFAPVRARLAEPRTRLRNSGADYLAYALVDCIVDSFFPRLESYGDRLEALESEVIAGAGSSLARSVHETKHDLLEIRRVLWPQRDAVTSFLRDDAPWMTEASRVHLRDAIDHLNQLLDLVEAYHDFATGLMSLNQSFLQQKTNEIMRVLTMLASIFIPLTFIVGVYGMNFDPDSSPWNMPELRWKWGYPAVMLGMGLLAAAMVIYFRRRGWTSDGSKDDPGRTRPV